MTETATKSRTAKVSEDTPVSISEIDPKVVLTGVLKLLGKPRDLRSPNSSSTRATAVTKNSFRVNIYTESKMPYIAHSYFVKVNEDGQIVSSNPEIIKQYE